MSNAIYDEITQSIIDQLESGALPWIKPWKADATADHNIVSGKAYQGINRLILGMSSMAQGFSHSAWASYKQWAEKGGQVRKGSKGTKIIFYSPIEKQNPATGEKETFAVIKSYSVFNASQVDGVTIENGQAESKPFDAIAAAENRIIKTGALINHGGDAAFYHPSSDRIQLPNKSAFENEASYYATAFHELTHWTGHQSRLDRDFSKSKRFGDSSYAFEELVAEMGAAFLCQDHGIQGELRHAGYIGHWLKVLRDDNRAIFKAAALAQKSSDFINAMDATVAIAA